MRILFFLFFNAVIHCQENFKTVDNFLYDIDSKLFKIISNDSIYSFNLDKKLVKKRKISSNDYNPKVLKTVINDSFKFFASNETNIVVDKKFNKSTLLLLGCSLNRSIFAIINIFFIYINYYAYFLSII